jgi:hypothetical protein
MLIFLKKDIFSVLFTDLFSIFNTWLGVSKTALTNLAVDHPIFHFALNQCELQYIKCNLKTFLLYCR